MLNLFELFSEKYIPKLVELNKIYLVTQTYSLQNDHFSDSKATRLLVTDYDNLVLAKTHKDAVKNDRYSSIINLTNEKHLAKLKEMLSSDSNYLIYWAVVKSVEQLKKRLDLKYKDNVRRYILKNTTWRIGADETLHTHLKLIFGELFMILRRGSQELRVKFVDIEKS